ncbi:hypothetical protein NKI19_22300 [Mesorhizobium sp. M0751]|uniref:hypothetical protein n=1 Tax=unclassified Mesorhizobium TaxID=325217 RepID=UPI0033360E40
MGIQTAGQYVVPALRHIEKFLEFLRRAAGAKARYTDESASGAFLSSMALAVIRSSLRFY